MTRKERLLELLEEILSDGGSPIPIPETVPIPDRFYDMGKYPVTFEEYDAFCEMTGREKPDDEGWGRGRRPVINVSWDDAQDYVTWLSVKTGRKFHLPTEDEWEYVARAGKACVDEELTPEQANFGGNIGKTTEVGSYPPNPWGLYDMHGNVWEWVEDEWE